MRQAPPGALDVRWVASLECAVWSDLSPTHMTAQGVPALLAAIRGIDGSRAATAVGVACLALASLILLARWRAARRTSFPGLREVNAWRSAATARAVGVDTLDEVRVVAGPPKNPSTGSSGTTLARTMPDAGSHALGSSAPIGLVDLRAELHGRIDTVQRRMVTAIAIGVLLGMVLGLLL